MELQIIKKQEELPAFDREAIQIKYFMEQKRPFREFSEGDIPEHIIAELLEQLPYSADVILSLNPYSEDDWMEVLCDGEWLALGYSSNGGKDNYYSYNPDFEGSEEYCPLRSGGQTPIERYLALKDIRTGIKAVEYFIRAGKLYPGIDWAKQL